MAENQKARDLTKFLILPQIDPNNILHKKAFLLTKKKHFQGIKIHLCDLSVEYTKKYGLTKYF